MKINYFFIAVGAVLLTAACQKEDPQNEEPLNPTEPVEELVPMTFTASCEDIAGDSTKVYFEDLDGDLSEQYWSNGDQISHFSGTTNTAFTNTSTDGPHAIFEGTASSADVYYAMYPYQEGATIDGTKITGTFPQEQKVSADGGTAKDALIAVATTTGTNFKFYNAFGLIKFKFEEDTAIQAIIIEGNNGEFLSGTFTVDASSTEPVCEIAEDGGKTNIVLRAYDGNSYTTFNAGTYAATIPPTTFENGFKIIYRKADGKCSIKNVKSNITISRRNARDYTSDTSYEKIKPGDYNYYYILTKDDLDQWATNTWSSSDVVYLGADIDCNKEEWENVRGTKTFSGIFDGRGHSIYNLCVTEGEGYRAGFFYTTSGTVKNVSFGKKDGDGSYIKIQSCSLVESWYYAGPIAYANGGTIQNVTNYIPVSFQNGESTTPNLRIGGIAGTMKGNTKIIDCINYGSVTCNDNNTDGAKKYEIGGIVSRNDGTGCTISGCKNYGAVTNNCKSVLTIGGVVGSIAYGITSFSGCENHGDVTNKYAASADTMNIGGVVGYIPSGVSVNIETMKNYGKVSNTAAVDTTLCIGGVVGNNLSRNVTWSGLSSAIDTSSVSNTGDVTGDLYIGGVIGLSKNPARDISGFNNSAAVSNSASATAVYMGGITGYGSESYTNCTNTGTVTNSGSTSDGLIYVGGIIGRGYGNFTLSICTNGDSADPAKGEVSNSGLSGASTISVGGIAGSVCGVSASTLYATLSSCKNYGPVTNSGTSTSTQPGTRIGGLVGWSDQCVDLTSANENHGTVTESSSSTYPTVGGVTGYVNDANSKLAGCANYGAVTASGESVTNCFVGGIVAYVNANATLSSQETPTKNYGAITASPKSVSVLEVGGVLAYTSKTPAINYASNEGSITSTNVTVSTRINLGGVVGAHDNTTVCTLSNLTNTGTISATGLIYNGDDGGSDVSTFGGIEGSINSKSGKTYSSCTNNGAITVKGGAGSGNPNRTGPRVFVGGIMGYGNLNPTGSSCAANITVLIYNYETTTSKSCIGGICGLWALKEVSDLKYEGALQSTGSSPAAYISGIVGRTSAASGTYTNCCVGGSVKGAGSSPYAGLFISQNTENTIGFSGCKVQKNTVVKKSSNVTITTDSQLTLTNFCGGTASKGSITGCSVVSSF